jgi:LysM domain
MMSVENSSDTESMEDVPVEDYFDDIRNSTNARGRKMGSGLFDLAKVPFLVGIGALVLIIMMVFIFSGKGEPTKEDSFQDLEKRMVILEDRIVKMGKELEDILKLERQNKRIDVFMDRYARLEADLSLKVDLLEKKLDKIQRAKKEVKKVKPKTLTKKQKKSAGSTEKSAKKINNTYHQVRAGETLYSISRQYGIAVNKLKALNRSITGDSIYPGQKLRVAK